MLAAYDAKVISTGGVRVNKLSCWLDECVNVNSIIIKLLNEKDTMKDMYSLLSDHSEKGPS